MVKRLVGGSVAVAVLAACAGVVDLDVKYKESASTADGGTPSTSAPVADGSAPAPLASPIRDAASGVDPSTLGHAGEACPCDDSQGLACCSTASGASCTSDQSACDAQNGAFLRCSGPDLEGSFCCLHRRDGGSETALAASCQGTSIICTFDADCPNAKCTLGACPGGVTIGTCDGTPVCP